MRLGTFSTGKPWLGVSLRRRLSDANDPMVDFRVRDEFKALFQTVPEFRRFSEVEVRSQWTFE